MNFEEALFLVFTEILQNDVQGKLAEVCPNVMRLWVGKCCLPYTPKP